MGKIEVYQSDVVSVTSNMSFSIKQCRGKHA